MSLDWDITKVAVVPEDKDERTAWFEQVSYEQPRATHPCTNWQLVETLLWRSLSLAWGWRLTEDKVETAIKRNAIYEAVHNGGVTIPPAFIADMVGLTTNVTQVTDAAFMKNVRRWLEEYAAGQYKGYLRAAEKQREAEVEAAIAEHDVQSLDSEEQN